MPSVDKIYEIAQYFKVSTDSLLGITDDHSTISVGDISGNQNSLIGTNNSDISIKNEKILSSKEETLLEYFNKLDEKDKTKALLFVIDLAKEK